MNAEISEVGQPQRLPRGLDMREIDQPTHVYVVDDDVVLLETVAELLNDHGFSVQSFLTAMDFLAVCGLSARGCLLLDMELPGMSGLELQCELDRRGVQLPIVFLSGHGDLGSSSQAFRAGAVDFLEKPVSSQKLLDRVKEALLRDVEAWHNRQRHQELAECFTRLSHREQEVVRLVVAGYSTKEIARNLGISNRTVDVYRAHIMEKTHSRSIADLVAKCVELALDSRGDMNPAQPLPVVRSGTLGSKQRPAPRR